MEDLKHECGVALVRLKKPLSYYEEKYGTKSYALNKLYLLMQKQHNRGQEGAGVACVTLSAPAGEEFIYRERKEGKNAIPELFQDIGEQMDRSRKEGYPAPFIGECYMGHLRYSTTGRSGLTYVHPHLRRSYYRNTTFALCGNFNLTNVQEIFGELKKLGMHPRRTSDTTILLEQLGYHLDNERGNCEAMLKKSMPIWDGGFVICGLNGVGEMFAARDRWGIRSAFVYDDEECVVIASERPAIQTVMNVPIDSIVEIQPGQAAMISADGEVRFEQIVESENVSPCSFERIYFSRGSDRDIYVERKALGSALVGDILKSIDGDIDNSVFSFIPNTAEVAFWGMFQGLNEHLNLVKCKQLADLPDYDVDAVKAIIDQRVRIEKVAIKDIKLRTFISESGERNELANHVYDITYGSIVPEVDNLVAIDDSIVRGTTLRRSIITILSRLKPKKLVIVSSAPQIRYPDYYGIDMSNIADLIAFRAVMALAGEDKIEELHQKCLAQKDSEVKVNHLQELYGLFTDQQISDMIAKLVTPVGITCPVEIIYQSCETLSAICSAHPGDWYFSGNYPTKGGLAQLNETLLRFFAERKTNRSMLD